MQPNGNVIVDTICRTAKLGTTITGATENGDVTVIEAEPVEPINECPTCGQPGVFRDHVIRSLVDLPIVGHPTTSCAPSTLPVHQQALLAEDLPCWPCLRARQFKDHGPGDPLDPATTLPKSDERCRCTQVIRPGVGYEVSQVLFRLMKPVFETTYGAQRTPMPKLPQHRLPHQTHDSGIHTLNPHAFGCPPIEWDIDARVRDFAERMGDEYTSLYEQDTTSIKGGDFERFGAFADNHLDFIRALTKARGMDPISSDREIGAFLNTFDKLAAMPEPTPAKQEKDELSAGACDPADPLNLEQSSSYGMTR